VVSGKNHLGDRNEFLPTVHGFDEFFGNLYHLNAEEEPEQEFYPKDPPSGRSSDRVECFIVTRQTHRIPPRTHASA
jgi:arylsulfatase A-like enzyme